jgi:hypothetical protein
LTPKLAKVSNFTKTKRKSMVSDNIVKINLIDQ